MGLVNIDDLDFNVRPHAGPQAEWISGASINFSPGATWAGLTGQWKVTVSPLPGQGANFDPSTPGTISNGIIEAAARAQATGLNVAFMGGTYLLPNTPVVLAGLTNVTFEASAGAVFVNPTTNIGVHTATAFVNYPAIVFSGCSYVTWEGGQFTAAGVTPNYLGGFQVADNNQSVTIRKATFSGLPGWAILAEPDYYLNNGIDTIHNAGGILNFCEEYNTYLNCGNTTVPDGGAVRLGNETGNVGVTTTFYQCKGADLGRGCRVLNSKIFGYDFLNSQQSGWSYIEVWNPTIDFGSTVAPPPQKVGIFLETIGIVNTNGENGHVTIHAGAIRGAYRGISCFNGWNDVRIESPSVEYSWNSGIYITQVSNCTLVSPSSRGNNQGANANPDGQCGLFIGVPAGVTTGLTTNFVELLGGHFYDDTTNPNGSATQVYGVVVGSNSATQTVNNIFLRLGVANMYGNTASVGANVPFFWGVGVGAFSNIRDDYPYNFAPQVFNGVISKTMISYVAPAGGFFIPQAQIDASTFNGNISVTLTWTGPSNVPQTIVLTTAGAQGVFPGNYGMRVLAGTTITIAATGGGASSVTTLSSSLKQVTE